VSSRRPRGDVSLGIETVAPPRPARGWPVGGRRQTHDEPDTPAFRAGVRPAAARGWTQRLSHHRHPPQIRPAAARGWTQRPGPGRRCTLPPAAGVAPRCRV